MLKQNVVTIIFLCIPKATGRATRGGRAPLPFCEKQKKKALILRKKRLVSIFKLNVPFMYF